MPSFHYKGQDHGVPHVIWATADDLALMAGVYQQDLSTGTSSYSPVNGQFVELDDLGNIKSFSLGLTSVNDNKKIFLPQPVLSRRVRRILQAELNAVPAQRAGQQLGPRLPSPLGLRSLLKIKPDFAPRIQFNPGPTTISGGPVPSSPLPRRSSNLVRGVQFYRGLKAITPVPSAAKPYIQADAKGPARLRNPQSRHDDGGDGALSFRPQTYKARPASLEPAFV